MNHGHRHSQLELEEGHLLLLGHCFPQDERVDEREVNHVVQKAFVPLFGACENPGKSAILINNQMPRPIKKIQNFAKYRYGNVPVR